jgi:hypothetical protein
MKRLALKDSGRRGWFIGAFPEAILQTDQCEVCITDELAGPLRPHYHTQCQEIMLVIRGSCIIQGEQFNAGDIVMLDPGEVNDTVFLEPSQILGVKVPAGGNDKVYVD